MKRLLFLLLVATQTICSAQKILIADTLFDRTAHEADFAFGADVSFVPQMEGWGTKWLDKNGKQKDILRILKEQGINSIRLRVWTVASGASSKAEVVNMCKRCQAMGMSVMIDFHYSDTWADPGSQTIPSAWTDTSVEALERNIYDHTYDVLSAIKAAGVVPKWVQVGNETKRGMLYPVGQTNKGGSVAFARFVQSGYKAVKDVDPSIQVIVHLPDGHDNSLYRSIFDGLKKNGAKWDIIGLSAYPRWSHLDGPTMITRVMANINDLKSRYNTPCMVVETGHYPTEALVGNQYLAGVMSEMIKNGDLGCFYWEPESMGGYDMGAWDADTRKPTIMMDAYLGLKYSEVNWLMTARMIKPSSTETLLPGDVTLKASVRHVRSKRLKSVLFYFDRRLAATLTASPFQCTVPDVETGLHTAWVRAMDFDKNSQMSDTIAYVVGEAALIDNAVITDGDKKGGTIRWGFNAKATGKYRIGFKYGSTYTVGTAVILNGNSVSGPFFTKNHFSCQSVDIEVSEAGFQEFKLEATGINGLPNISEMYVFPLEGQALPTPADEDHIGTIDTQADGQVGIYSLSGILVGYANLSQFAGVLGDRASAVVVLPATVLPLASAKNCVGGTPYVVRKLRLK